MHCIFNLRSTLGEFSSAHTAHVRRPRPCIKITRAHVLERRASEVTKSNGLYALAIVLHEGFDNSIHRAIYVVLSNLNLANQYC